MHGKEEDESILKSASEAIECIEKINEIYKLKRMQDINQLSTSEII